MRRNSAFFLTVLGLLLHASWALAAPRDKAALKKIKEAIEVHFLNTDFDTAEGLLVGTIRACEDKCSPDVLGKAWMYVGVVRGAGRNDISGAAEAFSTAIASDPNVQLDADLASDPVKQAWAKAKGGGGGAAVEEPAGGGGGGGGAAGGFTCTPMPTEIETRRPFPMECETDVDLASAKLHYKAFGTSWTSVKMAQFEGNWRGTIPCTAFGNTGSLKYYVEGLDGDNEVAASLGSKDAPQSVDVSSETTADPPAFPGEEQPPARCSLEDMPPPGSGGGGEGGGGGSGGAWGTPCGEDGSCSEGLTCMKGTCESAQCKEDSDCEGKAECVDGRCEVEEVGGEGPKNWITAAFALDLASISSDNACAAEARADHIACFYADGTHPDEPNPNAAGKISGGFAPATMRVLASFERLFGAIGAELRLGFAFNGGQTPEGGSAFLPIHAELRGKLWPLGKKSFAKPGFRPWVHLGGGMAQIDATVNVQIIDCSKAPNPGACRAAPSVRAARQAGGQTAEPIATKQLGNTFVTAGGGFMFAIAKNHGPFLNVNFMIPFPSSGFVIEPALGYGVGF